MELREFQKQERKILMDGCSRLAQQQGLEALAKIQSSSSSQQEENNEKKTKSE